MWNTVGHEKAVRLLQRAISADRVSHAYLLTGPRAIGKLSLAMDIARAVNCTGEEPPCGICDQCARIQRGVHADVQIIGLNPTPEEERSRVNISIEQVRDIQREASLKPYEGKYRVFVFDGAEILSEAASNALLKILEEPPDQVIILLLASNAADLPPTIVSRCQLVELRLVSEDSIASLLNDRHDVEPGRAAEIAQQSGGAPGWAVRAAAAPEVLEERSEMLRGIVAALSGTLEERFDYAARMAGQFSRDREGVRRELDVWLDWWRRAMLGSVGAADSDGKAPEGSAVTQNSAVAAVNAVLDACGHLERNVNARLALEHMMLRMPHVPQAAPQTAPGAPR